MRKPKAEMILINLIIDPIHKISTNESFLHVPGLNNDSKDYYWNTDSVIKQTATRNWYPLP
jgi:hypothetical protein